MIGLPIRDRRYVAGASTPHPIRINNALWKDFEAYAQRYGVPTSEAVRRLMELAVRSLKVRPKRDLNDGRHPVTVQLDEE